jgi:hypothetical protein
MLALRRSRSALLTNGFGIWFFYPHHNAVMARRWRVLGGQWWQRVSERRVGCYPRLQTAAWSRAMWPRPQVQNCTE